MSLVDAHILAQERLRALARLGVHIIWRDLRSYDDADVPRWLARVLPLVDAAQRQCVALTDAYLARALGRRPLGLDAGLLIGAAVRGGTPPADVYRRPLVEAWTKLGNGVPYDDAIAVGLARATQLAATDVQLTHRATLAAAQTADPQIRGYKRKADNGACPFCTMIDGAFVKSADAMALHPGCGCSLEPVVTYVTPTPTPAGVAVRQHGELGPTLGDPAHTFSQL